MALVDPILPYGFADASVTPITAITPTYGTPVDLPVARSISFSEAEDFEELRGDDKVVTTRGKGPSVSWELEAGGVSLAAKKVMVGGAIASSGTTPAQVRTFTKKVTDVRPFFMAHGKAISDSGGDGWMRLPRCRATGDVEHEMADGAWLLTGASGIAIGNYADDILYEIIQHETETSLPTT